MTQAFNDRTPLQRLLWLGGMAKAAGGKGVEETASGNPCVFETNIARPLKRLAMSLLPRQSGTGDPSPENIRPLLPWGEVAVGHAGKNLIKSTDIVEGYVISANGAVSSNTGGEYIDYIPVIEAEYTLSAKNANESWNYRLHGYDANKQWVEQIDVTAVGVNEKYVKTFKPTSSIKYIRLSLKKDATEVMLEPGSTATEYEEYTDYSAFPVDLTGITPPVYGCSVDLTTGEVWGTHVGKVLTWEDGTNEQPVGEGYKRRRFTLNNAPVFTGFVNSLSDKCVYNSNSTSEVPHFYVANFDTGTAYVYIFMPNETSETEEITVVSKLQTPVLLATLTPQQISAIVGVNTVWSDADNVDVTYLKKG